MCILDKISSLLVNLSSLEVRRGGPASAQLRRNRLCSRMLHTGEQISKLELRKYSRTEDCQESDFDRERFVDISTQMIAQFFQATDAF